MAQIVTYKILQDLAKAPLVEAEGQKFYDQFKMVHAKLLKKFKSLEWAYTALREDWLKKHCPPIKYIGKGSSRAAFAMGGGLCLKVACNEAGKAQNRAEAKNLSSKNDCFTMLYGNADDYTSILVECVVPCVEGNKTDERLKKLFGLEHDANDNVDVCDMVSQLLSWAVFHVKCKKTSSLKDVMEILHEMYYEEGRTTYMQLVQAIMKPKNEAQKILGDLAQFTINNYKHFLPADLSVEENWGFATRNNQIVAVVLDAGFSQDVKDEYYK